MIRLFNSPEVFKGESLIISQEQVADLYTKTPSILMRSKCSIFSTVHDKMGFARFRDLSRRYGPIGPRHHLFAVSRRDVKTSTLVCRIGTLVRLLKGDRLIPPATAGFPHNHFFGHSEGAEVRLDPGVGVLIVLLVEGSGECGERFCPA
jgi:hypothetical protein